MGTPSSSMAHAAEQALLVGHREAEALAGRGEHALRGGHDLGPHAVAGQHHDAIGARSDVTRLASSRRAFT